MNIPKEVEEYLSSLSGAEADDMAVWVFKHAIGAGSTFSPRHLAGFMLAEFEEDELDRLDQESRK
jgi:hypothetical protein